MRGQTHHLIGRVGKTLPTLHMMGQTPDLIGRVGKTLPTLPR